MLVNSKTITDEEMYILYPECLLSVAKHTQLRLDQFCHTFKIVLGLGQELDNDMRQQQEAGPWIFLSSGLTVRMDGCSSWAASLFRWVTFFFCNCNYYPKGENSTTLVPFS